MNQLTHADLRDVKDHLAGLIEDIYISGNIPDLEFHLGNVLVYFGLNIPDYLPVLSKAENSDLKLDIHPMKKTFDLEVWKNWNNDHLKKTINQ